MYHPRGRHSPYRHNRRFGQDTAWRRGEEMQKGLPMWRNAGGKNADVTLRGVVVPFASRAEFTPW